MTKLPSDVEISPSTVNRIIQRNGLVKTSASSRPAVRRFERRRPNALWQMDFKGQYRVSRGWCFPLTILDDHSRFSLEVRGFASTSGDPVKACLVHVFRTYGLPEQLLIDHGTPWWSPTNGWGLTKLAVYLIEQGIELIYGAIAHPQTRGKIERFHRTLNEYLTHHGKPSSRPGYQRRFAVFRQEYNHERPHESLQMDVPASRYKPSQRRYEPRPASWQYDEQADVRRLNSQGAVAYGSKRYFVCEALAGKWVECREYDGRLLVTYRHMQVRDVDLRTGRTTAVVRPVRRSKKRS